MTMDLLEGRKIVVNGYSTTIHLEEYSEGGRLAIILVCDDDGQEYGTLTVNMPEVPLEPDEIIVKRWSENVNMSEAALMSGLFQDTGKRVATGFVQAHIWRISEKIPNVRFWEYINHSLVKLTLPPEQIINWSRFSPTEEGWMRETRTYEHEDGMVTLLIVTEGKDCDGRIKTVWEGYFDPHAEKELPPTGLPIPVWHEKKQRQRDYTAEALGY
ncbi:MAG TPA: hypothetical protein PKO34_00965 [Smithellaceae bacterium]|nr:MAG: hypothetical protein BWY15_02304 [Firmicutes bacterium ADurb.Bin193]HNS55596.1 hypothetical protein [Smithellaceae bacterium]